MTVPVIPRPPTAAPPPPGGRHGRPRRTPLVAILVVVLAVLAGTGLGYLLTRDTSNNATPPAPTPTVTSPTPSTTPSASPSASASTSPSASASTSPSASASTTVPPAVPVFRYLPLFPFANGSEVLQWQSSYSTGGHQPWHLDAAETARAFTVGYLGLRELDAVLGVERKGNDAWVSVGYRVPGGASFTAAVVHVAKFGTGALAPWEVSGTRDTSLSLTTPHYGSTVGRTITIGGRITGVDENLVATVHQLGTNVAIGQAPGVPAGGMNTPWTSSVTVTAGHAGVATVLVTTGGHLLGVERFAVTGVRLAP